MYLIRIYGHETVAHIWEGNDTRCKMYSTGGIVKDKYNLHDTPLGRRICRMCQNIGRKDKPKKPKAKKEKKKLRRKRSKVVENFYKSKAWRDLRYRALKKYGRICMCCGRKPPDVPLHVDHIIPRSKAPELELEITNLQILCEDCNLGKSNKDSIDYRITDDERYDLELLKKIPERF